MAMEWGGDAKLARQRSCACPPAVLLDFGGWCSRSGRRGNLGLSRRHVDGYYYGGEDDEGELAPLEYGYAAGARSSGPRWRGLWRRIVKGKRRIFGGTTERVPYDPFTYAQNFEERGSTPWMEPENLSRSFSSRFANPSGVLRRFA